MVKPGDVVRYLNDVGGGTVLRIEGNMAIVDDEGFETPVLVRECVVVGQAAPPKPASRSSVTAVAPSPKAKAPEVAPPQPELTSSDIEETPEGDSINLVVAFEPADIKHLSMTTYDAYLVNDSNYFLYFTLLHRASDQEQWATLYAGIVEPNIQLLLAEIAPDDLPAMDHVAVQYIAFKRDRDFKLKAPGAVEYKLDTTKFFKLHCFKESIYFDLPVIALDIVKDDVPVKPHAVDGRELERGLRAKKAIDRRKPVRRPVVKRSDRRDGDIIVVDLHITELLDSIRGLSAADMLNLQVDEFRRVMDANLRHPGQKIVFIHGKGEGVLRAALMKELNHRYKGHEVQDASFKEYGFGATQVTIKQLK